MTASDTSRGIIKVVLKHFVNVYEFFKFLLLAVYTSLVIYHKQSILIRNVSDGRGSNNFQQQSKAIEKLINFCNLTSLA